MAFDYKRLKEVGYVPSSAGSLFPNPSSKKSYVRGIYLFNGHTAAETVKLFCVPDSGGAVGTAGDANQFFEESLNSKEARLIEFAAPGLILEHENDSIQGVTTTASKVTVMIMGGQE